MNLKKKKNMAANAFKVGRERIVFVKERLEEIKDAITKADLKQRKEEGAIIIKEVKGRKKVAAKSKKRGPGNVRKKINKRKRRYVAQTRKQRKYVAGLKQQGKLSAEEVKDIRKKIKNKQYRSKAHLKELLNITKN